MAKEIRIGLLGASRIAPAAILRPAAKIDGIEVYRVAASSVDKARAYAAEHGLPGVERNYAALVTSKAVDLVYNALPPSAHMKWSVAALEAGKHVLCEKPFAMNAKQAAQMVAASRATGRVLIEAFHYRFHPLFQRILDVVGSGAIGDLESLSGRFDVAIPFRPGELRHDPDAGGGALMDLGCYPLHWVRMVTGAEPAVLSADAVVERDDIDVSMTAELEFPGDVRATISCSMQPGLPAGAAAELVVNGRNGRLSVINPLAPHDGHELLVETGASRTRETVAGNSTYFHQLEHVQGVLQGTIEPITGGEDAVSNMAAIDAIYRSAGMQLRGVSG